MNPAKKSVDAVSVLLRAAVVLATVVTVLSVVVLVGYILAKGVPYLTPDLFRWQYTAQNASLLPALVNTVFMAALSLCMAVPLGVFAAIYLTEYAKKDSRVVPIIRLAAETLSGIPSIVYGLFGMLFFLVRLEWGYSLLAGGCTMAIMILPLVLRTTEEALLAVPTAYREGAFGLGAGRLRTVFQVVLPSAVPGILSGVILGMGRVVSETAALIFTAGTNPEVAKSVFDSARTLAVHMYALSSEGLYMNQTFATAVVLIVLVIGINALSGAVANKLAGGKNG